MASALAVQAISLRQNATITLTSPQSVTHAPTFFLPGRRPWTGSSPSPPPRSLPPPTPSPTPSPSPPGFTYKEQEDGEDRSDTARADFRKPPTHPTSKTFQRNSRVLRNRRPPIRMRTRHEPENTLSHALTAVFAAALMFVSRVI
jgi:hypothetical protein